MDTHFASSRGTLSITRKDISIDTIRAHALSGEAVGGDGAAYLRKLWPPPLLPVPSSAPPPPPMLSRRAQSPPLFEFDTLEAVLAVLSARCSGDMLSFSYVH